MVSNRTKICIALGALLLLAALTVAAYLILRTRPVRGIPEGWSVIAGNPDQWTWMNGKVHGHSTSGDSMLVSRKEYRDVTISAVAGTTNREASFVFRVRDAQNGYLVVFVPPNNTWREGVGFIELVKLQQGKSVTLNSYQGRVMSTLGQSARITIIAKGPWIDVQLNNVTVIRAKDTSYSSGFIGLRVYGWGDRPCDATYSDLRFY